LDGYFWGFQTKWKNFKHGIRPIFMQRAGGQGRWSYDSARFASRERILPNRIRAQKAQQVEYSLRQSREFRSDQGAIWDEISEKADRMEARSPSMAMSAIYERQSGRVEEYTRHFRPIESQVGAVFPHKIFSN
jgi:hypothetical protein